MLLKTVNKIKKLADSMGPSLSDSPFGNKRTEEFDYMFAKYIYNIFKNNTKIILNTPNNEQITMNYDDYSDLLRIMAQEDNLYVVDKLKNSKNVQFNELLKTTLHSFEQMIHQNSFIDKHMPKTKDGKINHFYRAFMRSLIARKERNIELVTNKNKNKLTIHTDLNIKKS